MHIFYIKNKKAAKTDGEEWQFCYGEFGSDNVRNSPPIPLVTQTIRSHCFSVKPSQCHTVSHN